MRFFIAFSSIVVSAAIRPDVVINFSRMVFLTIWTKLIRLPDSLLGLVLIAA
jgi:hypothetical protein